VLLIMIRKNGNKFTCSIFVVKALRILNNYNSQIIPYPTCYKFLSFLHLTRDESRLFLKELVEKGFLKEHHHYGFSLTKKGKSMIKGG